MLASTYICYFANISIIIIVQLVIDLQQNNIIIYVFLYKVCYKSPSKLFFSIYITVGDQSMTGTPSSVPPPSSLSPAGIFFFKIT